MKDQSKDRLVDAAFILAILFLALFARIPLLPLESGDYYFCLSVWMDRIREQGGWHSLALRIGDYSSAYMYIMCLLSGFSRSMYALKFVSIFFDYMAAGVMYFLVREVSGNTRKGIAAMALTLLCPTLILNGAWWCQCDSIYVTFMLLALLLLVKGKGLLCCTMLGLALSFKVQAVFLLPFLVIMWLKQSSPRLWHFGAIPLVFFLSLVPAWIAGRPLSDLLGVYVFQAGEYPFGTLHYPNMYEFFQENNVVWHVPYSIGRFGLYFSFAVLGVFAYWMYHRRFRITPRIMVTLALFSVSLVLFTMPHMHERYGLFVDVLSIAYAILRPKMAPLALGVMVISLLSYIPFLNRVELIPAIYLSLAMLALNTLLAVDLSRQIKE